MGGRRTAAVALLTDFGLSDPYVGIMKGVLLSVNPEARIVDLVHDLPPGDVRQAAFQLRRSLPWFPPRTVFVCVVDPGVGTARGILALETAEGIVLAPDNGLAGFLEDEGRVRRRFRVTKERYFRRPVSPTFHGRDVFAPVAGHLSLGLDPSSLGPKAAPPRRLGSAGRGTVASVDRFGNLVTDIPAETLPAVPEIRVGRRRIRGLTRTYGDVGKGTLIALVGSAGTLEISVSGGDARKLTGAKPGDPVRVKESGP